MNKSSELLPCPFCGCNETGIQKGYFGHAIPACTNCGASLPLCKNAELAAARWNTRAEVYIAHPITGEPMDKSQCKRVITQMADQIKYLKEQLGIVHRGAKTLTQMSIVEGTHEKT
ncbi:Lar family restriction alleviation protein [Oxalobacter paraformigenes]|uniref:Restriction alleviation protein, Lar family n=1 Tax=Oxalobacter paraformigenes TaxID=556268 RepID=T5LE28_9BURK|nr:Lar family restriction alleviation protein [Oxalobacter paraformigenes]EQM95106.1 hypothetical protein OFAG_02330 [Oxalobacter paraformigenes]